MKKNKFGKKKRNLYSIPKSIVLMQGSSPVVIGVFGILKNNGAADEGCIVSTNQMAKELRCTANSIFVALRKLKEQGVLEEESELFGTMHKKRLFTEKYRRNKKAVDSQSKA